MAAVGRPTIFAPQLINAMLDRIASGDSVRSISKDDRFPAMTTFFRWLRENEDFRQQYARAKEIQAEFLAEDLLDIADDGTNDYIEREGKDGNTFVEFNSEHFQRSRLRVDTRKWIASKLLAKKYGDKIQQEVTGKDGAPLEFQVVLAERIGKARERDSGSK